MLQSKIQYILTWVALGVLLICGILLMAFSWNSIVSNPPSPSLMVLLWILLSSSGIFLFLLAVKKAHRQWIDEERGQKRKEAGENGISSLKKDHSKENQVLDVAAMARKLVRRTPEKASLEEVGKELMKNLARDLEIMSGVFYLRKRGRFEAVTSYALASHSEPYQFKEGDGLTGQVARNQQLMVLTRLPEDHMEVYSGLGKAQPAYLAIVPFIHKNKTVAVLECSGYRFDPHDIENMLRIYARDLMEKLSPNLS
jgi:hypothetical protein